MIPFPDTLLSFTMLYPKLLQSIVSNLQIVDLIVSLFRLSVLMLGLRVFTIVKGRDRYIIISA